MSQNFPFLFGAGGGQPPTIPQTQQQQHHTHSQAHTQAQQQHQPADAVQSAFNQNAPLPGMDMSALAGISPEQLAAIGRLFQTGALALPPQEHQFLDVPAQVPTAASAPAQAPAAAPHVPQISNATPTQEEDIDTDKEEGELEEGEVDDTQTARGFLRPPPTGPRNRSSSPRGPQPNKRKQSPRLSVSNQPAKKSKKSQPQPTQVNVQNGQTNVYVRAGKDEEAKLFVLQMVQSGYSFEDLAKEVDNQKPLIRLFHQLRLPIPPKSASTKPPQSANITAQRAQPHALTAQPVASEDLRKSSVAKRPAPAKPTNRNEYVARLQALKNKKADARTAQPASAKPVENVVAPSDLAEQAKVSETNVATLAASAKPPTVGKAEDKTELARRRLEALKAQQAAKQNGALQQDVRVSMSSPITRPSALATDSRPPMSSPVRAGLGAGIADIPAKAEQMASIQQHPAQPAPAPVASQPIVSPMPPTPSRSFSGLPGLFMFGASTHAVPATPIGQSVAPRDLTNQQASAPVMAQPPPQPIDLTANSKTLAATPTETPAPLTVPRKRPVASDFNDMSATPNVTKRPFGQSRGNSEDESLIIEVSEDEDEDVDMDADDVNASLKRNLETKSFRDVGPLRDFPPRPAFQVQSSGPGTPGPGTPGGVTYEQRMKEIEEMKRKIAEAEKRKIATGKNVIMKANENDVTIGNPTFPTLAPTESNIPTPDQQSTPRPSNLSLGAETSALDGLMRTALPMHATNHERSVSSDRPMSAAALARQQEKERLTQRLLELEQDESKDVNAAVEAAAEEPEPVLSSTSTYITAPEVVDTTHVLQQAVQREASREAADNSASEEGELSDDSMSNIYGLQNAQDTRADDVAPVEDRKIGSQTSTASAMSGLEPVPNQAETANANGSQWPDSLAQDADISTAMTAEAGIITPGIITPVQTQLPDSVLQDSEMIQAVHEPVSLNGSMGEDEDEEEEEEEDSDGSDEDDEDLDDLDRPLTNRHTDHVPTQHYTNFNNNVSEEGELDESDLSNDEEAINEEIQVGEHAALAAISDATPAEPIIKNDVAEDDLAPELQPAEDERTDLSAQVSKFSEIGSVYAKKVPFRNRSRVRRITRRMKALSKDSRAIDGIRTSAPLSMMASSH